MSRSKKRSSRSSRADRKPKSKRRKIRRAYSSFERRDAVRKRCVPFTFRCQKGHKAEESHWLVRVPLWIWCPTCLEVTGKHEPAVRVEACPVKEKGVLELCGFIPTSQFEHRNYGLIPSNRIQRQVWEREGRLKRDEAGMLYYPIENMRQMHRVASELGVGLTRCGGIGDYDEKKQFAQDKYLTKTDLDTAPWDDPKYQDSIAERLARDPAFREFMEKSENHSPMPDD